ELGEIYAQVYGPIPEDERVRLARYVQQVRQGVPVSGDEAQAARQLLRQGIDSLPEEARARLQALNDKAFRAGLGPPCPRSTSAPAASGWPRISGRSHGRHPRWTSPTGRTYGNSSRATSRRRG